MAPRILIRSHDPLRRKNISGGAARLMINIGRALAESGWEVTFLSPTPDESGFSGLDKIEYQEFNYRGPESSVEIIINTVRGARKLRDILETETFDIILDDVSHYPFYPAHYFCPEDTENALFLHLALFGAAREFNGFLKGSLINLIDRTLPRLNHPEIVCAGESTEGRIHSELGYGHTQVLHPCIEVGNYNYNFSPDSDQILYLGRLGVRKNVSCLLKSWSIVESNSNNGLSLVIAGSGPKEKELKGLSRELGLEEVDFRGYVAEEEKLNLLEESLLTVIPSKMEGYVTTGLESLASGTPVIGADTFGINDYIGHEQTGFLFPCGDHEALAEEILRRYQDPAQMEEVVEQGHALAMSHSFQEFKDSADKTFSSMIE